LLIVVFLKQTAAIKVEAPPTSLIFDGCHSGAPKGTSAGERKPNGSRPAHTCKGTSAPAHGDRGAKAARGWAAAAHFVCFVLLLCYVLLVEAAEP